MSMITCKRCKKQVSYQKGTKTENFLCYACLEKVKMMKRVIATDKNNMPKCCMCGTRKSSYSLTTDDGEECFYCQSCKNVLDYEYDNWEKKGDE